MEQVINIATPGFSLKDPPQFSFSLDLERFDSVSVELQGFIEEQTAAVPGFVGEMMLAEARWMANQKNIAEFITDSIGTDADRFVVYIAPSTIYYGGMLIIKEILDLYLTTVRKYPSHEGRVALKLVDDGSGNEAFDFVRAHLTGLGHKFEVIKL